MSLFEVMYTAFPSTTCASCGKVSHPTFYLVAWFEVSPLLDIPLPCGHGILSCFSHFWLRSFSGVIGGFFFRSRLLFAYTARSAIHVSVTRQLLFRQLGF